MDPNQIINLNQNTAQCIQSASYFGKTVYTNICSGAIHTVEWGGVDWLLLILGMVLGIGLALSFLGLISAFIYYVVLDN